MDQGTELLHASMAQIMADVKGLAMQLTDLSKREVEHNDKLLALFESIESRVKELEAVVGEGAEAHPRKTSGGSKSISNKHPMLKVCLDRIML